MKWSIHLPFTDGVQIFVRTFLLSLCLSACGSTSSLEPVDLSAHCHDKVSAIKALAFRDIHPPAPLSSSQPRPDDIFDVNQYFSVLDQLSMQEGFMLDFAYFEGSIGGEPILYPRRSDQPAYQTYSELTAAEGDLYSIQGSAFHTSIHSLDSETAFLQFVLLKVMGSQFYLKWHANYNDYKVICSQADLEAALLEESDNPWMTGWVMWRARRLRPQPQVVMQDDSVQVKIVVFTKWGGFIQRTYTISRQFPHTIIDIQKKTLVPYDCGFIY